MLKQNFRNDSPKISMKRFSFIIAAIFSVFFTLTVSAQKETPPAGAPPKPFVFPAQETFTLSNGMKVTLVQYGSVPKVAMQAAIYTGTKDDARGKKGVSEMTGAMLKEATKTRSGEQIARETAEMGGNLNVSVGTDSTNVAGEVLSEFDIRFLNLMADVVMSPNFRAEDLERLRANKLRSLAVAKTQAGNQAWEKFREVVFPNHPYGQLNPTEEEVKSYTLQDINDFYAKNYGAAKTHLFVVGQFNKTAVKSAIEKAFAGWMKGTPLTRNPPTVAGKYSLTTIDRPNAPQSTIYLGVPAPNPKEADYIEFAVMDALLGGSFGSRITSNIRENKGYTYSPSSFNWTRYQTGYWIENADVTTQFTGASIKEILYEINRLKTEPVTEAELQGIKNYMAGIYVLQNSTRFGVIGQLEEANYYELDKGYIDSYVKNILAVTPQDIQNVAQKYLSEDKMAIVVVGDKSKIDEQLKPYQK